ncbi:MAG: methionine--tRNA ligase [Patescibacteria group bacterium]|nr:methionine--tRNA ligase [Patescibacteria group bacterium]MDE2015426.1 methionine--tRNA ligase [Patescibacteria group bacterium]MDE2226959.1 methionine--tRNA ligase [Patescibacteria group bacterium]
MKEKEFYITTTLPYVNAPPHLGHALELVRADIIARYHKLKGYDVFFNTGTDEHGLKIYRNAVAANKEPQSYADEYAAKFESLMGILEVDYSHFSRTTDPHHVKAAQEFWKICDKNGYIKKKLYKVKYCVGCELEKTESELKNGRCPLHPNLELEIIEEENYFFKFSEFQKPLLALYKKYPDFVLPNGRLNEIKKFIERGPVDFSISRLKEKMPWGVNVPGDESHVMYVWFDALVNYISALGWPEDKKNFEKFWGTKDKPRAMQIAGKDNLRQQAAMWQAMLMGAGLPTSRQILINGFITSGGEKMSKSLGNVADPVEIAKKYGADALRYWLAREIPAFEDGDFSQEKFKERYNGDLANGLGNFASRVLTLGASVHEFNAKLEPEQEIIKAINTTKEHVAAKMEEFKFHEALAAIWELIAFGDEYVNRTTPWDIEYEEKKAQTIFNLVVILDNVAALLRPFMPSTSEKITKCIEWENILKIKKCEVLFPRIK